MVDDMIDTGGTLVKGVNALLAHGATSVTACATHPVLSHPAVESINASRLKEVVVTNTIPCEQKLQECSKIKVLSVAPLLGRAIKSIHEGGSISTLFAGTHFWNTRGAA
jgi:ribose-phosphate pyrophosphokinase